jgi:hypothetical protein
VVVVLTVHQLRTGLLPDVAIMKHVGDTLVWWGGIVASGSTLKKMTSTIKGTPPAADPAPAAPGA